MPFTRVLSTPCWNRTVLQLKPLHLAGKETLVAVNLFFVFFFLIMFFLLFSPHYVGNYACLCGVGARKIIGQYKS